MFRLESPHSEIPVALEKSLSHLLAAGAVFKESRIADALWRKLMHARKQVRDILVAQKMRRWCDIARCPQLSRGCSPGRARKNFWYLWRKYPEIAAKLGLHEWSVFKSL